MFSREMSANGWMGALLSAIVWVVSYRLLPKWTAANGVQRINFASINAMMLILLYLLTRVG